MHEEAMKKENTGLDSASQRGQLKAYNERAYLGKEYRKGKVPLRGPWEDYILGQKKIIIKYTHLQNSILIVYYTHVTNMELGT